MTEERLLAPIDLIIGSVMNDAIPDVIGVVMGEVIEIHGLGKCLKDNIKLKCEIIVENLHLRSKSSMLLTVIQL
ncbi:hypothetical protein PI124_g15547 [Phytophthora idaei]|nr:hypothetical protein PI125_g15520 [Phytophthora idaei]KAG3239527.1 hypothetical protein PI124_g15547 [Phytophthora idaei]